MFTNKGLFTDGALTYFSPPVYGHWWVNSCEEYLLIKGKSFTYKGLHDVWETHEKSTFELRELNFT